MPIIRLEMLHGRTLDQKRELADVLTRETARIARCSTDSIQIVFAEVSRDDWAVGGVLASELKKAEG
jgi:4-oxalocrotonate tautomerase